jgi:hypothetical protein
MKDFLKPYQCFNVSSAKICKKIKIKSFCAMFFVIDDCVFSILMSHCQKDSILNQLVKYH